MNDSAMDRQPGTRQEELVMTTLHCAGLDPNETDDEGNPTERALSAKQLAWCCGVDLYSRRESDDE